MSINYKEFNEEEIAALEDYVFFKFATIDNDNNYVDIVDTNFNNEMNRLKRKFIFLFNNNENFSYNKNEFNRWLKDSIS